MTRIVAVGCGWVTLHRHIPAIRGTVGLELAGVVDRDAARARDSGTRLRVPHATSLDDPALGAFDAVSIGTAPMAHHGVAMRALALGKHVITEKPFAMTVAEADEMIAEADKRGRILAVVHNFQFARSVAAARRIAESGKYGRLRGVIGLQLSNERRRLPVWYRTLPGGLFYDEGPHLIYLVRAFLGDVEVAHVSAIRGGDPDDATPRLVEASFETGAGGPFGALQMSFAAALSEWQLVVLLERATLVCDIFRDILVRFPDDGLHVPGQILRTSFAGSLGHWRGVVTSGARYLAGRLDYGNAEVFRRFGQAVATGTRPVGISAQDGRAVVAALHRIIEG